MNNSTSFSLPSEQWRKNHFEAFESVPMLFENGVAGKSILNREIYYYKLGEGATRVMFFGAHHALEYITCALLYDFIDFVQEKFTRGESFCNVNAEFLLKRFTFWIFPCINPDGVEMHLLGAGENPLKERQIKMNGGSSDFSNWQANARGVDLNHNYNARFFEYKRTVEREEGITAGCTKYAGEYPESEPEVRAAASYVRTLMPSLIISLHSQGEEIYHSPSDERCGRLAKRVARLSGYKASAPSGSAAYGGLCDFSGALGIPSLTIEVGRGKNPLPTEKFNVINETVRKILYLTPTYL